jgi:hypothetical protein
MTRLIKTLRTISIVFFILLAAMGVGLVGTIFPNRERFMDNEIRTEQVDKKTDEEEESDVLFKR